MAEAQSDTYPWSQTEVNIIYWKFRKGRTRLNMEVYIIAFRSVRKPPAPTAVRVRHATFTRAREPDIFTNDIRARPGPWAASTSFPTQSETVRIAQAQQETGPAGTTDERARRFGWPIFRHPKTAI